MGIILVMKALIQRKGKLSDIEFLAIKEFGGKIVKNEGTASAAGDLATLTANSGKDMYIARAKCVFHQQANISSLQTAEVVLKINGTVVETATSAKSGQTTSQGETDIYYEFKNIGHKVAATEIIKLEVISTGAGIDEEGFIECFEVATGDSPQI